MQGRFMPRRDGEKHVGLAYALITLQDSCTDPSEKLKLRRLLSGSTAVINGKKYRSRGLVYKHRGERVGRGVYIVPKDEVEELSSELKERNLEKCIKIIDICECTCI
uniref:Uncharacterized protein n=1 Tax=Fervidicoccus fontis TaxID=683846 RepID=A0A7J3SMJ7_9CREN